MPSTNRITNSEQSTAEPQILILSGDIRRPKPRAKTSTCRPHRCIMTTTEPQPANSLENRPAEPDYSSGLNLTDDGPVHAGQGCQDDHVLLQALLDVRHLLAAEWSSDILTVLQPGSLR